MGFPTSRALATGRPWSGGRIWAAGSPASMKRHPRSGSGPARCHAGRHAAIDDDLAASDVARGVAGEEQQRAAISRGLAGTSNATVRASSCGSVGVLRPLASSGPILFQSPVAVMPG